MEITDVTITALKGNLLERLSTQLGESPIATRRGLEQAIPLSVAGLAAHASTESKAEALLGTLRGGNYPRADATEMAETALNPDETSRLARSGTGFLSRIFGDKLGGIADMLAGQSGVSKASAASLLGLAAPMVLNAVGKEASARNLDARGLSQFLADQGGKARRALPPELSSAMGAAPEAGSFSERVREGYDDYRRKHREGVTRIDERTQDVSGRVDRRFHEPKRSRWPVVVAGLALLGLLGLLISKRGHAPEAMEQATSKVAETAKRGADTAAGAAERAAGEAKQAAGEAKQAAGKATGAAEHATGEVMDQGEQAAGEVERVAGGKEPAAEPGAGRAERSIALAGGAGALSSFLAGDAKTPQRFTLEGVQFAPASASLEGNNAMLDEIAGVLEDDSARVRIEGHADASGDAEQNGALSQERASAVKDYLVSKGVPAERIESVGTGSMQPVASNDTPQGRAENRRADLIVLER